MRKPSIFTNWFIILILFITPPCSYSNNQTDFEALLAFKKSIKDDPLGALSGWNETTHFCRWNGISCSRTHPNRVVSLTLRSQSLTGSLPPHIGNLSFLTTINLQNNTFRGPIPEQIGRLTRLQIIIFSNNSFEGGIPRNLSHCTNLFRLNLIDNQLTGSIVPEIASLTKLQNLALSSNMLPGAIPQFLGNLTNLRQLSLAYCGLQGQIPESLVQLRRLRGLFVSGNNLTGSIPSTFFNLSTIEILVLANNQLHGTIPSFTFPNLWYLDLTQNHFTGSLPPSLSNSSLIQHLHIGDNNFTGVMVDLTRLSSLKTLTATSTHLKGDINTMLSSLTNCTQLRVLQLFDNYFTGSLSDSIGNLSIHLFNLHIAQNQISGTIPSSIANLVGLTVLGAHDNNLQGPIPSSIGKLNKLQEIYLGENMLTEEMPLSLGNLTLLNNLGLMDNYLSGTIPQSLGNCTNLLRLDLSDNNLNGSIPSEVLRLSSISIALDLSYNHLIGTIPSEVGSLRNLGFLDLSHNRLSGKIPTTLSSCVMLEWLYLNSNSLQGEIPDSLRALRGLTYLDLSEDNFSGSIPIFLAEFRLLLYLNLSFNDLEGEAPTVGVFQNTSVISLQGNQHLCGGIAILNFTSCPSPNSKKKLDLSKILIISIGGICLGISILCLSLIMYRKRTLQKNVTPAATTFMVPGFFRLSYANLLNATGGFSESNLLGAGRFGSVYKGTVVGNDEEETRDVAVKVLNVNIKGAFKSFLSECNALRDRRHRNLLKIINICDSIDFQGNDFKALVYEFMTNGSLEDWLHHESRKHGRILSITHRLDIAIDIASGVEYLHSGADDVVIHGDLKPSNILLDQDMVAHVGDFGLARIISQDLSSSQSHGSSSSSAIKGTIGYIPPEYGMNHIISTHGDVYSYGILLLEMFTGTRPTSDAFHGYINLQDFVRSALPDRVIQVVDPFLHNQLNEDIKHLDCIGSILKIGVRCSEEFPRNRMLMPEVVNELKKIRRAFLVDIRGSTIGQNLY